MTVSCREKRQILFLEPVFKQVTWGGDRLKTDWNYQIPGDRTGECWAVCAHPNGDCRVREGLYAGRTLSALWREEPGLFGDTGLDRFPLLTKILDVKEDLSIQVHPDDAYAKKHEGGSLGKTECWYVLDAKPDATLVFGHNAKTREELLRMVTEGRFRELVREIPVRRGDFIQVEPGTVHAIENGVMILEIQENSDITYRIYDYDRLVDGKPRPLHVERGLEVITVPADATADCVRHTENLPKDCRNLVVACGHYRIWKIDLETQLVIQQDSPFLVMSVVAGAGHIDGRKVKKGDHFILPCGYGEAELEGKMEIIAAGI